MTRINRLLIVLLAVSFTVVLHADADAAAAQPATAISVVFPLLAPKVSSKYGQRIHPIRHFSAKHNGVDLAAPEYSHVRAIAPGRVVFVDHYLGYGKLITIEHNDGNVSLYGHLDEFRVNLGQKVKAGELIGRLGSTGMSTGPHLHFEWRKRGIPVDPLREFPGLAKEAEG
jgi:murein DD-endopeptidase MepM/ murein hydrolase activator NlpD